MKKAILTNNGSLFGKRILAEAARAGSPFDDIIAIRQPMGYYWRLFRGVARRLGVVDTLRLAAQDQVSGRREAGSVAANYPETGRDYSSLARNVHYTDGTNSSITEELLRQASPDILILGQCGIVRKRILDIPKIGALNAHPGVLPWYRGMDSYKWALTEGQPDKIGASVHWVDQKVDTGNIISVKRLSIPPDCDYNDIQAMLHDLCARSMVETILRLEQGEELLGEPQTPDQGKQYYKMPPGQEPVAIKAFAQIAKPE